MTMVSKQGVKLLRWMETNYDWFYYPQIEKACGIPMDYALIDTLRKAKYIDAWESPDALPTETEYDIPELLYRISDLGKAYLETRRSMRWSEIRNWASLIIALAAFIKSFFF